MSVPTWDLRVPDFDPKSRSIVTMAAGPQFIIAPNHLPLPEGIQGVREWVYHLPLRTAERVMKLVNEESQDWLLDVNQTSNQLSHLYTTCAWGSRSRHPEPQVNAPSKIKTHLLFVIQSPWLLSPADFKLFCERSMYRHYAKKNPKTGKVEVTQLDYVDKLWATIYDDCVRGDTHYFVLTTYNEWAFGAFSRGWTTAWITPPKPYNAGSPSVPGPTILQSILFWMHSAQQFAYTDQRTAKSHSIFAREGLDGELENPSRATSPFESDFESETDDNTLDKSWLNEMRSSMRAIKDIKGVQRLSANGSWVIPEVSADYVPWQTYETEFRERAGVEVEVGVKDEDTKSPGELYRREPERNKRTTATRRYSPISRPQVQPWDFYRPCTVSELGAGGNMAAALAIAAASRAPPPPHLVAHIRTPASDLHPL
ncbi:hypothetical protein BDV93DRAFT_517527 [Ceratobasidium sp. AG-I]|nr:hypothetical protein BDV93DRAFT_517527 [Ceratobasidium sp. AG-I]